MPNVAQGSNLNRIGSKFYDFPAGTGIITLEFAGQNLNGLLKNFYYKAPNLTTDADFLLEILDGNNGNVVLFDNNATNLADTQTWKLENQIWDNAILIACDNATVKISWATSQSIAVSDFQLLLPLG